MSEIQVIVPMSVFEAIDGMAPAEFVKSITNVTERNKVLQQEVNNLSEEMRSCGYQLETMLDTLDGMELSKAVRNAIHVLKTFRSVLETPR